MNYDYKLNGVNLSPAMKEKVEKQLIKFEKFFLDKNNLAASIRVESKKDKKIIEVTLKSNDFFARADVIDNDFYTGIDKVVDKLNVQLKKTNQHLKKVNQKSTLHSNLVEDKNLDDAQVEIIKHKQISLVPMDLDEAICRMEALDHNFFIYLDSSTGKVNVLYERKDKKYGLIELNY